MNETIEAVDPATEEIIKTVKVSSPKEVSEKFRRAEKAQEKWKRLPVIKRCSYLKRMREVIVDEMEDIVETIKKDTGKPDTEALMSDVFATLSMIKYYEKNSKELLSREKRKTPMEYYKNNSYVEHEPLGIVAVISPWNYPFQLSLVPSITALAAGNSVILKPSEVTPLCGEKIEEILSKAGFPKDVFHVVQGAGEVGEKMVGEEPDKIFFTGGTGTGKKVMKKASEQLIPVELELGGKDPMIVFKDADIERAAKGAVYGALANSGQLCVSIERVYVQESVEKKFVRKLMEEVKDVRSGSSTGCEMGPMIRKEQIEIVKEQVEDAVEKGADLLTEFKREGRFLRPLVLTDVDHEMKVMKEETFGPVISIMPFKDEAESVRLANDSEYGLNSSVWSEDEEKAKRVASELQTGNCYINDVVKNIGNPDLPFGGKKNSGIGRYHGPEGLEAFTETKSVMINDNDGVEVNWFPYSEDKYEDIKTLVRTKHGDVGFFQKIKNLLHLRKLMKSRE